MSRFMSERMNILSAYTPGEQPADTQKAGMPSILKLNTNESPYPPSPGVIKAISEAEIWKLNLYPNPDGTALIEKIAEVCDVPASCVIIGNGSDELLAFAFLAFFCEGVVFSDITYGFYPVYGYLYDRPYAQIPLNDDFTINIDDYIETDKNIVLANPNAPTGIALSIDDVEKIVKSNTDRLVLIDEAYVDFGAVSAIPLIKKHDNLLVIHTYSKARSLAGARLAYAVASEPVINDLRKIKFSFNPYNVNRLTQIIGLAALVDDDYYKEKQSEIVKTREYTAVQLSALGFEMTDSKANFLFARCPHIGGEQLYLQLKERNILIRHWNNPRISDYVRITIGTKNQMDTLIAAITEVISNEKQ